MFSKSCEYGIKAIIQIAYKSSLEEKINLKQIAQSIESPTAFTAKILQQLTSAKVIQSIKGVNGGYYIPKQKLNTIYLSDIVKAIDGDKIFTECGLGLKQCNEQHPCPIHNQFKSIRNNLQKMLESTNLKQLAIDIQSGCAVLKN